MTRTLVLVPVLGLIAGCAADAGGSGPPTIDDDGIPLEDEVGPGPTDGKADGLVVLEVDRPADLMPPDRLARFIPVLPEVEDPALAAILGSPDTMWYDRYSIVPGYQDSFGDNVIAPIGMRPNSISSTMIDLAVPGGHRQVFVRRGQFHFPFGRTGGADSATNTFVIDFWMPPRRDGPLLPVVWWWRRPSGLTHRIEWAFPVGSVLGEVIFLIDGENQWYAFEVRTRTRAADRWTVDVFRPFPTAGDLAAAIEQVRESRDAWRTSRELDALVAHLRDPRTLEPATLRADHFASAFPGIAGARDVLPALSDPSLLLHLLRTTPFRSARDAVWKENGRLRAYAPTTRAELSIVPRNYDAGFFEVNERGCDACHRDAGRPFRDFYQNIIAYGELWGEDDTFSWHPFDTASFVDARGNVRNFNYDNRRMRQDLVSAGLVAAYDPRRHAAADYTRLSRAWKNYRY